VSGPRAPELKTLVGDLERAVAAADVAAITRLDVAITDLLFELE